MNIEDKRSAVKRSLGRGSVLYFIPLFLMLAACSGQTDDSIATADAAPVVLPCDENTNLDYDFHHCGACDTSCSIDDADSCIMGVCMCGSEPSCGVGFDCRNGSCVAQDPTGHVCEFDPECPAGHGCVEGRCTSLDCVPEECDGVDNDCDRRVDEGALPGTPLAQYCGPVAESNPPCRQGSQICSGGDWSECSGAVYPISEAGLLACDGIDNDCDGCIDSFMNESGVCERFSGDSQYDVVFIVDTSGSMHTTIVRVNEAIRIFSSTYSGDPNFRFSLVTIGRSYDPAGTALIRQDLTDVYSDFEFAVSILTADGSGSEGTYDAPYSVMMDHLSSPSTDTGADTLALSWNPGAIRILVNLTDEYGQSYRRVPVTHSDVCAAASHGELLVWFTPSAYRDDYTELCGTWFNLYDLENFSTNISSVFVNPCP